MKIEDFSSKPFYVFWASIIVAFFMITPSTPAKEKPVSLKYSQGRVSFEVNNIAILPLLRQISRTAGIDIIIFDPIKNEDISIELIERPVEYAVKRLLKGYNHVVLFTDEGGRGEVRVLGDSQENISSGRRDQKVEASLEKVRVSGSRKSSQTNRLFAKDKSIGAKLLRRHLADAKKNEENQISTGKGM